MPSRAVWRALDRLVRRVNAAARDSGPAVSAVGVSCVGPADEQAGTVSPPYVPGWNSFALREHLEELTDVLAAMPEAAIRPHSVFPPGED